MSVVKAAEGKKSQAAGIAAVGGSVHKPEEPPQGPFLDPILSNVLEMEISAARAVGMASELPGYFSRVEAVLALHATPRAKARESPHSVEKTSPLRAQTTVASTRRTDHQSLPLRNSSPRGSINKQCAQFNDFLRKVSALLHEALRAVAVIRIFSASAHDAGPL